MIASKLSVNDAQGIYRDNSQSSWRILRYIQTHPKACERTNGRLLVAGLMASTRGEGTRSGLECRLSKLVRNGIVLKTRIVGSGKGQRADYKINYYNPECPSGLLELAPEEEKERVRKLFDDAEAEGGTVDKYGAIVKKTEEPIEETEKQTEEPIEETEKQIEESIEEIEEQIEESIEEIEEQVEEEKVEKSDTIKENAVTVKQTEKGLELTINLNISINGVK